MRIAWFSPFTASGLLLSEIFSHQLLPCFKKANIDVDIFVDDNSLENCPLIEELPYASFHFHKLWSMHRARPYSLFIYLLEDSPHSRFVQLAQRIIPGVSVFFDLNLNKLYLSQYLDSSSGVDINREMQELFGVSAAKVGDWHARKWSIEVFDQLYKRGKREHAQSALSFVLGEYAKQKIEIAGPVEKISLPISKPRELSLPVEQELRKFLGISKDKPCIGFTGTRILEDRIPQVLEAIRIFQDKFAHDVQFVWLNHENEVEKARSIFRKYATPDLELAFVGYQDQQGLRDIISLLDLMILSRFDPERAWPLALFYALSAAKPCIVSNSAASCDIPDDVCAKVDLGQVESQELAIVLNELLLNHNFRYKLSANAKNFSQSCFDTNKIFAEFRSMLEKNLLKVSKASAQMISEYEGAQGNIVDRLSDEFAFSQIADKAIVDFSWSKL